jgi:hypothetical protein
VSVKPCTGIWGTEAERISDSVFENGLGGGGWSRE